MPRELCVSFHDVCLSNFPPGRFECRSISASDARAMINAARAQRNLRCVSDDDLLAPYHQREHQRHDELRALLRASCDITLSLDDFLAPVDDDDPSVQCIIPLQLVEVQPERALLVISCSYTFNESRSGGLEERLALAPDSLEFFLFESLAPPTEPA